eukprot:NODE_60_length_27201_cov_1.043318.p14 type:complete len:309 gc:universal NODE_60_length_27201_cov_1.043318:15369-16295(+)
MKDLLIIAFNTDLKPIRRKKQSELSLCSQNIQIITMELASFHRLTSLYLCCNSLKNIPPSILELKELTFLSLKVNEIKNLPDLRSLTKLKEFDISQNKITTILGLPKSIKKLNLSSNSIAKLPQSIGELSKLQHLNVSNNPLINMPSTIHKCRYLAKFMTANCLFVPKISTNAMPSLKELAARNIISSQQPITKSKLPSHIEVNPRRNVLRRLAIPRKSLRIGSNKSPVDSILSVSTLTISNNTIPKHLMTYFDSYRECASCSTPIWNYCSRYSVMRRDVDIPIEHQLCSSHWDDNDERIMSFFEPHH